MSYLLGQMEATRIIGEAVMETGQRIIQEGRVTRDVGIVAIEIGQGLIMAADRMQQKMRDQAGEGNDGSR